MFVTVKYGDDQSKIFNINCRNQILLHHIKKRCQMRRDDDQSKIFNINCRNQILLHHIKKRCQMRRDEVIELSDETGAVKNLRQNLDEYGYDYLKERETLILLRVETCMTDGEESDSITDKTVFTPMLMNMSDNQDFIDILNPKENIMGSKHSLVEDDKAGRKVKPTKDRKKEKKPKPPKK